MIANYNNIIEKYNIYHWPGKATGDEKSIGAKIVTIYLSIIIVTNLSDWLSFHSTTQGAQLGILGLLCGSFHTVHMAVNSPVHSASISLPQII